jgi:hypothetical protein
MEALVQSLKERAKEHPISLNIDRAWAQGFALTPPQANTLVAIVIHLVGSESHFRSSKHGVTFHIEQLPPEVQSIAIQFLEHPSSL